MPWVVREAVRDINRAVGRRWHAIDPLLPDPASLPAGCGEPLGGFSDNRRTGGLGVCVHQHIPPQSLNQTWGAAERFTLVPRLPGQDVAAGADQLLALWRDHLAGTGAARGPDTSASVVWPSMDITGVPALLRHGLQPLTVIAARTRPNGPPPSPRPAHGATIRTAGPADEEQVLDLELRLIRYDMHFGGPVWRQATARLVCDEIRGSLARPAPRTWLGGGKGPAGGPAARAAAAGRQLDRGHDQPLAGRLPADDVRRPAGARHRDRRGPGQEPARHARRHGHRRHAAAPQPGQPVVHALLVPDGLPPAVDQLGGAPRERAAVAPCDSAVRVLTVS